MKKSTQNFITTLLGLVIILAGVFVPLFSKEAQEFMTGTYYIMTFSFGLILIYVKNDKAVELVKSLFKLK